MMVLREGKQISLGQANSLIDQANGLVWKVELEQNAPEIADLKNEYYVTGTQSYQQRVSLRVLADRPPHQKAWLVQPTLEEAYLVLSHKLSDKGLVQ
jgi:ABC-2 type transport system ATP-binding protein